MSTKKVFLTLAMFIGFLAAFSQPNAWINEFHYDNSGTDAGEFVEVVIEDAGSYTLSNFTLVLYNGSSGVTYGTHDLSTFTVGATSGNFTIYSKAITGIQNGAPDGMALVYSNTVISGQFLSYEGTFSASDGPASGMLSVDIGVLENGNEPLGLSLQLSGTGSQYSNFTWQSPATATQGELNNSQTFGSAVNPEPSNYPTAFNTDSLGITINVAWIDATGTQLPSGYLVKISLADNITSPVDGTPVSNDPDVSDGNGAINIAYGIEECTFYRLQGETEYFLKIYPYTNSGSNIDYKTDGAPPADSSITETIITTNDFENQTFGTWLTYSVASNKDWNIDDIGGGALGTTWFAQMNGYQEDIPSNDWLISQSLNLNNYTNEKMVFYTAWHYGTVSTELNLYYSIDYTSGDPTSASWSLLTFSKSPTQDTWYYSGIIDLSSITGSNVHIAFQYLSSGNPRRWYVDEIAITGTGVSDPLAFSATGVSQTQVDLSWTKNPSNSDVLIAWNSSNTFGIPTGTYNVGDPITDGGTVLYKGSGTSTSHISLSANTIYYYKIWSFNASNLYSSGLVDDALTYPLEPTNHPSNFTATANTATRIIVTWTNSDADKYLIKASLEHYDSIVSPTDFITEANSRLVKNVIDGSATCMFTGLSPDTTYYFKIFPYNGTGETVNYKTDGNVPQTSATTPELDFNLIISEVADPQDRTYGRFVELYNAGSTLINFDELNVSFCRQANGANWDSIRLTGTLDFYGTYVIANTDTVFDLVFSAAANLYDDYLVTGNGDDGYYLFYDGDYSNGYLLDAFGEVDIDGTNKAWEYENTHAVRKRDILTPSTTWTASEWVILESANIDNMTPFAHRETVTWTGTDSDDWNGSWRNWDGATTYYYIPDASYNVTIPAVSPAPVVTEPSACNILTIEETATLVIQGVGGKLRVVKQE